MGESENDTDDEEQGECNATDDNEEKDPNEEELQ